MVAVAKKRKPRVIRVGLQDHGTRMSLDDFDRAIASEGHLYELAKGVIEVSEVPQVNHECVVAELRDALAVYKHQHPGVIYLIASGGGAKLLSEVDQSERHPDLLVYLNEPPTSEPQPWAVWIPEIVVEVVSDSSVKRDYDEKPPEYASMGVKEYWIIHPSRQTITTKTRWRSVWRDRVLKPGHTYTTTLLPGFKLDAKKILAAGK